MKSKWLLIVAKINKKKKNNNKQTKFSINMTENYFFLLVDLVLRGSVSESPSVVLLLVSDEFDLSSSKNDNFCFPAEVLDSSLDSFLFLLLSAIEIGLSVKKIIYMY